MSAPLPDHIDILRLARQGGKLVGRQSLNGMARLRQGILLQDDIVNTGQRPVLKPFVKESLLEQQEIGCAHVELEFDEDDERFLFIKGTVQADVYMVCQRCLEPMLVGLDAGFLLGIVEDEAKVGQLPEQYEPLVVSGKTSSLSEIIEDELILSLPLVALHETDKCSASVLISDMVPTSAKGRGKDAGQGNGMEEHKLKNPFSVLSALKKEGKKD